MKALCRFWRRLLGNCRDGDLARELDSHIQLMTDDCGQSGLSPGRWRALPTFSDVEATKERYCGRRDLPSLDAMNRLMRIAVAAIALAVHVAVCLHAADRPESLIRVRVDARIELMATIFRLAGNPEYCEKVAAQYVREAEKHFGPLTDHPAVRMAARLRKTRGIAFDAPMSLALHVTDPGELREAVPFDPRPSGLDPRWRADEAREFLVLARDFAKVSGFKEFFAGHKDLYAAATKRMEGLLESCHLREWFQKMFGENLNRDLAIVVGLQLGGNNYGIRVTGPGQSEVAYAIKGVWQVDENGLARFSQRDAELLVHEFCHSFANPVIDARIRELQEPAEALYRHVEFEMAMQSYGRPDVMLYESLVRGLVIRYLRQYSTPEHANMILGVEMKQNGFLWMRELTALLESYESGRATYADLESFAPRIVDFFRAYARDVVRKRAELESEERARWKDLEAHAPRIISMIPNNGDMNVDPGLKELTITFDRPVRGIALLQLGRSTNYPLARQGWKYDATGTILTVPLQLQPETYYTFGVNAENALFIQDRDGHPLVPVVVRFKTRKEREASSVWASGGGAGPPDGVPSRLFGQPQGRHPRSCVLVSSSPVMSTVQYPATEMLGGDSPTVLRSTRSSDSVGVTPAVRRARTVACFERWSRPPSVF